MELLPKARPIFGMHTKNDCQNNNNFQEFFAFSIDVCVFLCMVPGFDILEPWQLTSDYPFFCWKYLILNCCSCHFCLLLYPPSNLISWNQRTRAFWWQTSSSYRSREKLREILNLHLVRDSITTDKIRKNNQNQVSSPLSSKVQNTVHPPNVISRKKMSVKYVLCSPLVFYS